MDWRLKENLAFRDIKCLFTQRSVMKTLLCTNLSLYISNVLESAIQVGLPCSSRCFPPSWWIFLNKESSITMTGFPQWWTSQHTMKSLAWSISTGLREATNYLEGTGFTKLSQPPALLLVSRSWGTSNDARAHQGKTRSRAPCPVVNSERERGRNQKMKGKSGEVKTPHAL